MVAFNTYYPTTTRANATAPGAGVSAYRGGATSPVSMSANGGIQSGVSGNVGFAGSSVLWVLILAGAALMLMHAGE